VTRPKLPIWKNVAVLPPLGLAIVLAGWAYSLRQRPQEE
jgi:hypothetical protein